MSHRLSKGPFPLSPDRVASSVAQALSTSPQVPSPSRAPLPLLPQGPLTGHSLEFQYVGPWEGWAQWLTEALCRSRWVCVEELGGPALTLS